MGPSTAIRAVGEMSGGGEAANGGAEVAAAALEEDRRRLPRRQLPGTSAICNRSRCAAAGCGPCICMLSSRACDATVNLTFRLLGTERDD